MIPARERMTLTRLAWSCHAAAPRRGGYADRRAAHDVEEARPRREDRAPGPIAGSDRAGGGPRPGERPDRRGPADHHRYRAQVAGPVRRPRPGRAERPAPPGAAAADQRADPGRGGCAGLPAARRDRGSAVTLDRAGAAGRAPPGPDSRSAVGLLGAADLGRAPGQALAIPVLDLPPATRTSKPKRP